MTEPLRMHYALRRVQRMFEARTLRLPVRIIRMLESRGASTQDFEYMVTRGRVTELKAKAEDKRYRLYKVVGLTIEGDPAAFIVEERKGLGVVTRFIWPTLRGDETDEV